MLHVPTLDSNPCKLTLNLHINLNKDQDFKISKYILDGNVSMYRDCRDCSEHVGCFGADFVSVSFSGNATETRGLNIFQTHFKRESLK